MRSWWQDLGSIHWWLGVVMVGIVINLVSAYLKGPVDRFLSKGSRSWATRTEKQRQERASRIERLRSSQDEQVRVLVVALHIRMRAAMGFLLAGVSLVASLIIGTLSSFAGLSLFPLYTLDLLLVFAAIIAISDWIEANRQLVEVDEARHPART
jgi:hypothetical protein